MAKAMIEWIRCTLALFTMAYALTGCANMPGADGRYATHDRGRSNTRAEVPVARAMTPTVGIRQQEQSSG